jgi:hypothetical protein
MSASLDNSFIMKCISVKDAEYAWIKGKFSNYKHTISTCVCKWKMIPVETTLGMVGEGIKENDGGDEFNYDILWEVLQMPQCTPTQHWYDMKYIVWNITYFHCT